MRTLRKATWLWPLALLLTVIPVTTTHAEEISVSERAATAFQEGDYPQAIEHWLGSAPYEKLSADTLYNIGNAAYRVDSPGHAALFYRRALDRDSSHAEARQNLRFLERKFGSVVVKHADYQLLLTKVRIETWRNLVWAGVWLWIIGCLIFPATRRGSKLRIAGICACLASPLLVSAGALGWGYYPNDARFAPVSRQAVVIAEKAALFTDAARTSPEVIDAPLGSLCEVIKRSDRWAYVSFATKTRGWIPAEWIEPVVPDSPPQPIKIRKPKAGERSA